MVLKSTTLAWHFTQVWQFSASKQGSLYGPSNQCILIYYDILWYIMFSKDGPLAEKSAEDCGCFRDEQRACWGFIMLCQSWSWMVWEEYLMVQHLFDSLWISSKTNCQDIDFCDGNVLRLSLKNKACSSATAHPQLLHVLNRIVAHFKLENKKNKAEPKQVSNDLLDKFGYVAENPGEYLIYNQARHAARSHSLAITINHINIDCFRSCLLFFLLQFWNVLDV